MCALSSETTGSLDTGPPALSHWILYHRKQYEQVVSVWLTQFRASRTEGQMTLLYLANDIVQNSRKKSPQFVKRFELVLPEAARILGRYVMMMMILLIDASQSNALEHNVLASLVFDRHRPWQPTRSLSLFLSRTHRASESDRKKLGRVLDVWEERHVYSSSFINQLRQAAALPRVGMVYSSSSAPVASNSPHTQHNHTSSHTQLQLMVRRLSLPLDPMSRSLDAESTRTRTHTSLSRTIR